jgi:hypothetical protein
MARLRKLAWVLLLVAWYLPLLPAIPSPLLDSGWRLGLSVACERGWPFGQELVFTYGPYGCLSVNQYWPALYFPGLLFLGAVAGSAAWLMLEASEGIAERIGAFLCLALLGLSADTMMMALPLALAVHAWRRGERSPAAWLGLVLLGPLALAKFVLLPLSISAVLAAAVMRRGRVLAWAPVELALFLAAVLLAWLLAGQALEGLPDYLRNGAEVARGYPQAMAWPGGWGTVAMAALAAQLAVAALALAIAVLAIRQRGAAGSSGIGRLAWVLFLAAYTMIAIRLGVTRGEYLHVGIAATLACALGLLEWPAAYRYRSWLLACTLAAFVAVLGLGTLKIQGKGGDLLATRVSSSLRGWSLLASGTDPRRELDAALARAREDIAGQFPGLELAGGYDILGHDQYLVLGLGGESWRPRPVLQGYSAYTARLAALDAAFLAGASAPAWLLARVQTIDERLPMMDDPAIWPIVRSRYALERVLAEHLLLGRRVDAPQARGAQQAREARELAALPPLPVAGWTGLPPMAGDSIYAALELEPTLLDRLRTALWKPPVRYLEVRLAQGAQARRFRIVPEAARAGFLLSPVIERNEHLQAWLAGEAQAARVATHVQVLDESGHPVAARIRLRPDPFPLSLPLP